MKQIFFLLILINIPAKAAPLDPIRCDALTPDQGKQLVDMVHSCDIEPLYYYGSELEVDLRDFYDFKSGQLKKVFRFDDTKSMIPAEKIVKAEEEIARLRAAYMGKADGVVWWPRFYRDASPEEKIKDSKLRVHPYVYFIPLKTDWTPNSNGGCEYVQAEFFKYFTGSRTSKDWARGDSCKAGCLTKDETILTDVGYVPVKTIVDRTKSGNNSSYSIMAATQNAADGSMNYYKSTIDQVLVDPFPFIQKIYTFKLESRNFINVSSNHPLLLSDGTILAAEVIRPGQSLVNLDGTPVKILGISVREEQTVVYNLSTKASDAIGHLIVAQGVISGDLWLQNEGRKLYGRRLLRERGIPQRYQ